MPPDNTYRLFGHQHSLAFPAPPTRITDRRLLIPFGYHPIPDSPILPISVNERQGVKRQVWVS